MNVNTIKRIQYGFWIVSFIIMAACLARLFVIWDDIEELTEMHPMDVKRLECVNYKGSRGGDIFQCLYATPDYKVQFMADISAMEFKRYLKDPRPVEDNILVNQAMIEGYQKKGALTSEIISIIFSVIGGLIVFLFVAFSLDYYIRKNEKKHV